VNDKLPRHVRRRPAAQLGRYAAEKSMRLIPCLFVLLLASVNARADWAAVGAAYRCDQTAKTFEVVATMDSSDDVAAVKAPKGFVPLGVGRWAVACQLNQVAIATVIGIRAPQPQGMCGGTGSAAIHVLAVAYQQPLQLTQLGSPCRELPGLVSIKVHAQRNGAVIDICRGSWDWDKGFIDVRCEESLVPND
jgi:hypothetical protein